MYSCILVIDVVHCHSASRDIRADMPKLFRRRVAYDTENIAVAVDVMQRRVSQPRCIASLSDDGDKCVEDTNRGWMAGFIKGLLNL